MLHYAAGGDVLLRCEPAYRQEWPGARQPVSEVIDLFVGLGDGHDRLPRVGECRRRTHYQR